MPSEKHRPEEIIGKLREAEVVLAQGAPAGRMTKRLLPRISSRWRSNMVVMAIAG